MQTMVEAITIGLLVYFTTDAAQRAALIVVGWRKARKTCGRTRSRSLSLIARSPLALPVSIILPTRNEASVIVEAVQAALDCCYREFEVLVIDDGSTDDTLAQLTQAFALIPVADVPRAKQLTAPVGSMMRSTTNHKLVVISKQVGGRIDAKACGLAYARYPLVFSLNANERLTQSGLAQLTWPFHMEPRTVATSGLLDMEPHSLKTSFLARAMAVERSRLRFTYLGWERIGVIGSAPGALTVFRREGLVAAGGYNSAIDRSDSDVLLKLHGNVGRESNRRLVSFVSGAVGYSQEARAFHSVHLWQQGLSRALWSWRRLARPLSKSTGFAAPAQLGVFEVVGPFIEAFCPLFLVSAVVTGMITATMGAVVGVVAVSSSLLLSLMCLLIRQGVPSTRVTSGAEVAGLIFATAFESTVLRYLQAAVRAFSTVQLIFTRESRLDPVQPTNGQVNFAPAHKERV